MRIYKDRFYVQMGVPGISGFQRWNEREFRIVSGVNRRGKLGFVAEWTPTSDEEYRLENGRVPEFQPVVDKEGVVQFLRENPFQSAVPVGRALERLQARHGV